jgi:hypothetical protein
LAVDRALLPGIACPADAAAAVAAAQLASAVEYAGVGAACAVLPVGLRRVVGVAASAVAASGRAADVGRSAVLAGIRGVTARLAARGRQKGSEEEREDQSR